MQEKSMMNDYLSTINSSLSFYASVIAQTENVQLRQQLQMMRDQDEARQYKVYEAAKQKGFYKPAEAATQTQISTVKSELTASK
ncbi:spore coat protein [Clostridiaceae bacterium 14S0207]|nr:spore coat protein [Clostridiaceae bacterium 14S0207]